MTKFTREYYPISKAAALLGLEPEYLLHKGAQGSLPIFVMAEHWGGTISDLTNVNGFFYATPGEWVRLSDFAWLFPKTLRRFEDGAEEVTLTHTWNAPNPETGQERHIELDVPVVIKKTQLYVLTKDIENLAVEITSRNVEGSNKRGSRPKSASATEPTTLDLDVDIPKTTKPVEPVAASATEPTAAGIEERYMTMEEVCEFLKTSRSTINDAVKNGHFPKKLYPFGGRALLFDRSEIIAHLESSKKKFIPDVAKAKAAPRSERNQEAQNHEGIKPASAVPASAENKPKVGLTTHQIALYFDGIIWGYDDWKSNLADPPKWLQSDDVRITKGRKGRGGAATWNPAEIAMQLKDKSDDYVWKLNLAFKNPELAPWADDWKQYLSDTFWNEP